MTELRYIVERAHFAERLFIDPTLARGLDYYGPIFEAIRRGWKVSRRP